MSFDLKNRVIKGSAEVGAFVLYEVDLTSEIVLNKSKVFKGELPKNFLNEVSVEDFVGNLDF